MNLRHRLSSSALGELGELSAQYHRDPTADQIAMLRSLSGGLPDSRTKGGAHPTEDILSDITGAVTRLLGNIPGVGPLLQGLTGGGQHQAGHSMVGVTGSAALPGGGITGIPGLDLSGIMQSLGMGPAGNILNSILGAGLGGLPSIFGGGTGVLPGALGQTAAGMFGVPALPGAGLAAGMWPDQQGYNQLAQHTSAAGRAIVQRIAGMTLPELSAIRQLLERRASQIQATAEHRTINSDAEWRQRIQELLTRPTSTVDRQLQSMVTTYSTPSNRIEFY